MEKENIEVGKIYSVPKKFCTGENTFATMGELFKCIIKNKEGCLFSPVEGRPEKLFIKNDDLICVEEVKNV